MKRALNTLCVGLAMLMTTSIGVLAQSPAAATFFRCHDNSTLSVMFNADKSQARIWSGKGNVVLDRSWVASGARYVSGGFEFWVAGEAALWTNQDDKTLSCVCETVLHHGAQVALANPAAVYCAEVGGRGVTKTLSNGSEFGVCLFENNRQCGQWALLRGTCPVGGIRVSGYPSEEALFCVLTGGHFKENGPGDLCLTPNGKSCRAQAYYDGMCR